VEQETISLFQYSLFYGEKTNEEREF